VFPFDEARGKVMELDEYANYHSRRHKAAGTQPDGDEEAGGAPCVARGGSSAVTCSNMPITRAKVRSLASASLHKFHMEFVELPAKTQILYRKIIKSIVGLPLS
jgi:hypothetical protein